MAPHIRSIFPAEIVNRVVRHRDLVRLFDALNDLYRGTTENAIPRDFAGVHSGFEVFTATNFATTNFRDAVVVTNGEIYGLVLLRSESELTFRLEDAEEGGGSKHRLVSEVRVLRGRE